MLATENCLAVGLSLCMLPLTTTNYQTDANVEYEGEKHEQNKFKKVLRKENENKPNKVKYKYKCNKKTETSMRNSCKIVAIAAG